MIWMCECLNTLVTRIHCGLCVCVFLGVSPKCICVLMMAINFQVHLRKTTKSVGDKDTTITIKYFKTMRKSRKKKIIEKWNKIKICQNSGPQILEFEIILRFLYKQPKIFIYIQPISKEFFEFAIKISTQTVYKQNTKIIKIWGLIHKQIPRVEYIHFPSS